MINKYNTILLVRTLTRCYLIFLLGFGYGNHDDSSFTLSKKITLNYGRNTIDILSMMIGVQVTKFFTSFLQFGSQNDITHDSNSVSLFVF